MVAMNIIIKHINLGWCVQLLQGKIDWLNCDCKPVDINLNTIVIVKEK
jgi:hypothetical protein